VVLGFFFAVKNCWFKLKTSGDVPVGRRSHSAGELSNVSNKVKILSLLLNNIPPEYSQTSIITLRLYGRFD